MKNINSRHIMMPYTIGLLWLLSHPLMSVLTGEFDKPRGVYTDEHQLDPLAYRTDQYPSKSSADELFEPLSTVVNHYPAEYGTDDDADADADVDAGNMCSVLNAITMSEIVLGEIGESIASPMISCHEHPFFQVVKIDPISAPTKPVESLVIVVRKLDPYNGDIHDGTANGRTTESDLHRAMILMMGRLGKKKWLAKTLLFVFSKDEDLHETVDQFLLASGVGDVPRADTASTVLLPVAYRRCLIRQLLVLDLDVSAKYYGKNDVLQIITQGKGGLLPNLDMVSLVTASLRAHGMMVLDPQMHPFNSKRWEEFVVATLDNYFDKNKPKEMKQWKKYKAYGYQLGGLFGFMIGSIISPGPHAQALDEGIDALTFRARYERLYESHSRAWGPLMQSIEHTIRGLNSLSERLHHNTNQYFLPSSKIFVSHDEALVATILVILPFAMRALKLMLRDIHCFQVRVFGALIGGSLVPLCILLAKNIITTNGIILDLITMVGYLTMLQLVWKIPGMRGDGKKLNKHQVRDTRRSLQLITCLLALYIHVPILMVHSSLAIFSGLVWAPFIAIPSYETSCRNSLIRKVFLISTLAPIGKHGLIGLLSQLSFESAALAVEEMDPFTSTYMCSAYMPLHFMLSVLMLS